MPTHTLKRADWQSYFARITRRLQATHVAIEITGADLGAQVQAERLKLTSLDYDPEADLLTIATDVLRHRIHAPAEIRVQDSVDRLDALEIVDADGHRQILRLERLLTLPPPA
ncbi:MAG: DUF5335 domain-containing protein [Myxococcales bacterium]|nr:DUF5335 domain-containing protein [Myxococcales bacterium]